MAKLYIYIGVEARDLYIDEAHTALEIFRFVVFFSDVSFCFVYILVTISSSCDAAQVKLFDLGSTSEQV